MQFYNNIYSVRTVTNSKNIFICFELSSKIQSNGYLQVTSHKQYFIHFILIWFHSSININTNSNLNVQMFILIFY